MDASLKGAFSCWSSLIFIFQSPLLPLFLARSEMSDAERFIVGSGLNLERRARQTQSSCDPSYPWGRRRPSISQLQKLQLSLFGLPCFLFPLCDPLTGDARVPGDSATKVGAKSWNYPRLVAVATRYAIVSLISRISVLICGLQTSYHGR